MQETFEHNISQQLDDFKLQPSPIVWQEVDAALHPERKKRFIIWWWLSAAIIGISAISYWLVISKSSTFTSTKTLTTNHIHQTTSNTPNALLNPTRIEDKKRFLIEKEIVISTEKYQKAILGKPQNPLSIYQQNSSSENKKLTTNNLNTNNSFPSENIDNLIVSNNNYSVNSQQTTSLKQQGDSNTINTTPTTIDTNQAIKKEKKTVKPSQWLITIGGGILKTKLTNNSKNLAGTNASAIGSSNGGFNGATNNTQPTITTPKTGYNIQVGIAYYNEINKKWQLRTGLQYHYLTNTHGLKADTSTGFTNSFIADNNYTITNNAHWLELPVTFTYSLQPKNKHQFHLLMGGSLAYVVSEKWLISNTSTGRFYYNASANNRWLLGVHGGLSYAFSQKLNLAAIASYTLSPIQSQVDNKNHFVQYNLQLSTPITFSNKKKSKK